MRLIFAVLACALLLVCNASAEVELITEPRPGEEFVLFRASTIGSGRSADGNARLDTAPEPVTARVLSSKASGSLELVVGARTDNVDSDEVQTEVSVVTSKNVHVDGVTVKPAAASGVQSRPADHEEARIMARKIADVTKKATFSTEKPLEVTDTAASEHIVVKSEAESGLVKTPVLKTQDGEIAVPPGKFQSSEESTVQAPRASSELPPPLNVLSTGPRKASEEGGLHGKGVISDAPLVSAGSQPQSSRIVVKKGPNGEDYEYEYVYYYDDETDESANNTALDLEETDDVSAPSSSTSTSTTAAPTTTSTTTTTTTAAPVTDEKIYNRRYLPTSRSDTAASVTEASDAAPETDEEEDDEDEPPSRTRGRGWSNARGGNPQHTQQHEETERVRTGGGSSSGGRVRYTTIDRTRQSVAEEEAAAITERPAANEVVPARGGNRFRGRPQTEAPETTERLPQNTRFPPRRSNATPAPHDGPPARAAVRPSLELVDSSSFRTGAAISSAADLPSFPAVPGGPNAPVRFLGVTAEDAAVESSTPSRRRGRPTTTTSTSTSTTTTEAPVPTTEAASTEPPPSANSLAVEKAAYDLYAILQQAQDNIQENVVNEEDTEVVESTTPEDTTLPPTTTVASTTTSTSTTPEPSTEPSTTTTTAASSGRGRYRNSPRGGTSSQQNQNTRARVRRPEVSNAVPAAESQVNQEVTSPKPRGRFGSSTGRRTTTAAPVREEETNENEAPTLSTRPRNRFRAGARTVSTPAPTQSSSASATHHVRPSFPKRRGFPTSTAAPTQSSVEESEASSDEATAPASSSPKPATRANTRLRAPVRPLRAGRIGGLARPGALTTATSPAPSTTAVDASQESAITPDTAPASEEVAAAAESSEPQEEEAAVTTPQPGTLTRLRNRPRLHITGRTPKPQSAAQSSAASPSNRRDLVKSLLPRRGRPTPTPELEAEAAPVEAEAAAREEEELGAQEAASAEQAPPTSVPAPVEQEKESRLSSLLKKRGRKPGGLFHPRHTSASTEAP